MNSRILSTYHILFTVLGTGATVMDDKDVLTLPVNLLGWGASEGNTGDNKNNLSGTLILLLFTLSFHQLLIFGDHGTSQK